MWKFSPGRRPTLRALALTLGGALVSAACGPGTYCQAGPRYGTQCYSAADVRQPPGAPRPIDPPGKPELRQYPPGKLPW